MNNEDVKQIIEDCKKDLLRTESVINETLGATSPIVPYLTHYAVIRACGTIEVAFKDIITDHCIKRTKKQVKFYLENKVRNSSMNPSYDNICKTLNNFDPEWKEKFKEEIGNQTNQDQIRTSIKSLVENRNLIAHGGHTNLTITDIIYYFNNSIIAIKILDNIISGVHTIA